MNKQEVKILTKITDSIMITLPETVDFISFIMGDETLFLISGNESLLRPEFEEFEYGNNFKFRKLNFRNKDGECPIKTGTLYRRFKLLGKEEN